MAAPNEVITANLVSLVLDMARELPEDSRTRTQALAFLSANGFTEVGEPHLGGYPIETVISVLSKAPAHAKLAEEYLKLKAKGDVIYVNEGDFWMLLMCASQAATMLSGRVADL